MANSLTAELNLNIRKFTAKLNRAERQAKSFGSKGGRSAGKAMGKGIRGGVAGAMLSISKTITKSMAAIGLAAGVVFARTIQRAVAEAGQVEAAEMRFNILTSDVEKSNKVLTVLRQTAMRTGITFEAMAGNVGKFMAFGFSPEKAMELNKGILDVGGAVGMTNTDMKLLGVALSQVAAKGVGSMEELRQQIAEKGIPIFKALEEQLGVTGAELNKMIQEGKVSADVVLGLFTDVAKGKGPLKDFAGGADKMATTFQGKVGRMRAHWGEFLKRFGAPIIEALKPVMDDLLVIMKRMIVDADSWGSSIANAISKIENFTNPMATMAGSIDGFSKAWDAFVDYAVRSFVNKMITFYALFRVRMESEIALLGMKIVDVLTTGFRDMDFWSAFAMGQVGFFLNFTASLTNAAAAFVRKIEEVIPMFKLLELGDKMEAGAESLASGAEIAEDLSQGFEDGYKSRQLDRASARSQINDKVIEQVRTAMNSLDFTGAGDSRRRLEEILKGLTRRPSEEEEKMGPAEDDKPTTPGPAAFSGPMLGGKVDQMNNAIMGRSAFAIIAIEAQKATAQRDKTNTLLQGIKDELMAESDADFVGPPASLSQFA